MVGEFHYKATVGYYQDIFGFRGVALLSIPLRMIVQYLAIGVKLLFQNFILKEILSPYVHVDP